MPDDLKDRHTPMEIDRETKMIGDLEERGKYEIADLFRQKLDEKIAELNSR